MCEKIKSQIAAADNLRRQWAAGDARRDEKIPVPENITQLIDVAYTSSENCDEERWHLTDIYYPRGFKGELYPVIVSMHGGGWFYGDKKLYSLYTKHLATKGFAVVNFNYRLAPEYKYPCGFSDVCLLMDYLAENAERLKLDMSRLYLVGDSAGAQLVHQYSVFATNPEYRRLFDGLEGIKAPVPAKICLNCGIYEIGVPETDEISSWYMPSELSDKLKKSAFEILDYTTKDFPETFLMVSVNDGLMPCSEVMKKKLEELDIPFVYREYGQTEKSAGHVFHIDYTSTESQRCNNDQIDFFNK